MSSDNGSDMLKCTGVCAPLGAVWSVAIALKRFSLPVAVIVLTRFFARSSSLLTQMSHIIHPMTVPALPKLTTVMGLTRS